MKTLATIKYLGVILISLIIYSCSKEAENQIIGEWNLKSITSECLQGDLNEEFELSQSNDICCVTLSTTEMNDSFNITYTSKICQKLHFTNDTQLLIVNEDNSSRDTLTFTYQFVNDSIEACTNNNLCSNFYLNNDQIDFTVPITSQSDLICNRIFTYLKQ